MWYTLLMPLADCAAKNPAEIKWQSQRRRAGVKTFSALSHILANNSWLWHSPPCCLLRFSSFGWSSFSCYFLCAKPTQWKSNKKRKLAHNSSFLPPCVCLCVCVWGPVWRSVCVIKRFVLHLHYGATATITKTNGIIFENNWGAQLLRMKNNEYP